MREIVERAVREQADMEIVDLGSVATLREAVAHAHADVVIAGGRLACDAVFDLLEQRPRLKLLAVADDGRDAVLHELRPTRTQLGEVSPQAVVDAIRGAARATTS